MAKRREKPQENYLRIPNHIRNISTLGYGEKELLAHIYSFGRKGCYQSNKTLGKMFFRCSRTISLWIADFKKGGHILWVNGKGYYRTLYAKTHPDVKTALTLWYRGREIPKVEIISGHAGSTPLRNKLLSKCAKNCEATAQKPVFPPRKKLLHTNNITKKETTGTTTATPSPLPAGGQAPALLEDRKKEQQAELEQLKAKIGLSGRKTYQPLSGKQFEQERQKQLKALQG